MSVDTPDLDKLIGHLVIANRALAQENVVDAYGHVSVRHPHRPDRFFIARSLAPELVTREDIVELDLSGEPVATEDRALYLERFIHAGVYAARPDVNAVVHAHAEATLPYCVCPAVPLRPNHHSRSFIGSHVPLWDIADEFGDTNLLVADLPHCANSANTPAPPHR